MSNFTKKKTKSKFSIDLPDELIQELLILGKAKQISVRHYIWRAFIEITNQSKSENLSNSDLVSKSK